MNEPKPNCTVCEFYPLMVEIGEIGIDEQIYQLGEHGMSKLIGVRKKKLYQCPTCKTIKIQ